MNIKIRHSKNKSRRVKIFKIKKGELKKGKGRKEGVKKLEGEKKRAGLV